MRALVLLALLVAGPPGRAAQAPAAEPVRIRAGLITGAVEDGVRAFRGLPYAAPPVGPLRWKPPQPAEPWDGVRACTAFGPACPQPAQKIVGRVGAQSEDCLTLNVWTAAKPAAAKRPVMVWIHGGGFTIGASSMKFYRGARLARQGVVLVSINYRLGPFGFLAHPLLSKESEQGVSGNYGFLDQVFALAWVRDNVAAFGGDPGCVTIFGESAGSAAVCRHMVSPLSKGLFHRAIAQSGGAHGRNRHLRERWYGQPSAEEVGERLAGKLGCAEAADPLAALRAKGPEEILGAVGIDGWALPDDPAALFAAGKQHDVPFLVGSNADEATLFMSRVAIRRPIGYRLLVRGLFREHADEVLRQFPARRPEDIREAVNRLTSVSAFIAPARTLARDMARVRSQAYLYHFTRVPPLARARGLGATHGLEIPYVFGNLAPGAGWQERDRALSRTMSACWVRFAATGDPNGEGLPKWPPYDQASDRHLEFGDTVEAKAGLHREACDLMDTIQAQRLRTRRGVRP